MYDFCRICVNFHLPYWVFFLCRVPWRQWKIISVCAQLILAKCCAYGLERIYWVWFTDSRHATYKHSYIAFTWCIFLHVACAISFYSTPAYVISTSYCYCSFCCLITYAACYVFHVHKWSTNMCANLIKKNWYIYSKWLT